MSIRNTRTGWGWPARLLHWTMAALILGMLVLGFYMVEVVGDDLIQRFQLTQWHKSFGFVAFVLVLLRILWRAMNPTPALPQGMPGWERTASQGAHLALYVLMIAIPVSGWLMASASPLNDEGAYPMQIRNMVFGLFELPDPFNPGSRDLEAVFKTVHDWAGKALWLLLVLHVAAAIKHQFIRRDGLIRRMVIGR